MNKEYRSLKLATKIAHDEWDNLLIEEYGEEYFTEKYGMDWSHHPKQIQEARQRFFNACAAQAEYIKTANLKPIND